MPFQFKEEEQKRLSDYIEQGLKVHNEMDMLKEDIKSMRKGFSGITKEVSEELNIPKELLNRVILAIHKNDLADQQNALKEIEDLIKQGGH